VDPQFEVARGVRRWAPLGGVAFVVLFVTGTTLMFSGPPDDSEDGPAAVARYFADAGHRDRVNYGWILAGLGIFFFLWFVAALREAVRARDGGGVLTAVTTIGGTIYAALAFIAIALNAGIRTMSDDTYQHRVYPALIHAADDAAYLIHATGGAALAAMLFASSLALLRSWDLPAWLGWFGIVAAVAALTTIVFLPTFVWLLWIVVASVVLFLRADRAGDGAVSAART